MTESLSKLKITQANKNKWKIKNNRRKLPQVQSITLLLITVLEIGTNAYCKGLNEIVNVTAHINPPSIKGIHSS